MDLAVFTLHVGTSWTWVEGIVKRRIKMLIVASIATKIGPELCSRRPWDQDSVEARVYL